MRLLYKVAIIARFLNLTERRVQQRARDGIIPKAEKGKYDLVQCVHGYVRFLQFYSLLLLVKASGLMSSICSQRSLRMCR